MSILPGLIIALLAVLVISYLRNYIVLELQSISLLATSSSKGGLVLYSIILLPGTIIHELSHWLTAELLRVPTGEIRVFPKFGEPGSKEHNLGSVMTARTDPFRGFLIGTAPLFTGIALLIPISDYFRSLFTIAVINWQLLIAGYLIFTLSNSMMTSRQDRRYWPVIFLLSTLLYLAALRSGLIITPSAVSRISPILEIINSSLIISTIVNLLILFALFVARKILEHTTRRKITLS